MTVTGSLGGVLRAADTGPKVGQNRACPAWRKKRGGFSYFALHPSKDRSMGLFVTPGPADSSSPLRKDWKNEIGLQEQNYLNTLTPHWTESPQHRHSQRSH